MFSRDKPNALDTLCDSKLHHHGNHYQEKRVMKERIGAQRGRNTDNKEGKLEKPKWKGKRGREGQMPTGWRRKDDTTEQIASFDRRFRLSIQSNRWTYAKER